ncbi:hypothetical protein [Klebsiella oxytoca]|uniref:hypothetical protein n=1 Tax=Klebsiella oxytoca TaxID=571 RepID=UPI00115B5364|nr:hypothetical protein [Klebsiella oxytoca]
MSEKMTNKNVLIPAYAIKIKSLTNIDGGFAVITPDDEQEITDPITVTAAFVEKFNPQPGGYYIMCVNGVGLYSDN